MPIVFIYDRISSETLQTLFVYPWVDCQTSSHSCSNDAAGAAEGRMTLTGAKDDLRWQQGPQHPFLQSTHKFPEA
jgi:hypothetical protein